MNKNIYLFELRSKIRPTITWSIAVAAILMLYMSLFPAFAEDAELMNEMMQQFPEELLIAFGMVGLDLASVLGFFSFTLLFCQICLAIQASNYGVSLVSVEESELTADFLLTRPVTRSTIMTSKFLAALTSMLITTAVIWAASFTSINLYREGREYDVNTLLLMLVGLIAFQVFFMTVGTVISLLVKRVRSVTAFSMALTFGMYMLSVFGGMLGQETIELISPFKHFDPSYILANQSYEWPLVIVSLVIIVGSVAGSYVLYLRRDIHSVV